MKDPNDIGMEYNSNRDNLTIPEYGRNIQNMIQYAKGIEDPKARQAVAERIVELMQQLNPQSRTMEDYRERLWKHLFLIANYELEVDYPFGDPPTAEQARRKHPEQVEYPVSEGKYRHYGHNVQELIKKAKEMPEGPKRDGFVATISAYMKLAYRTWHKEHYVSDDIIKDDLERLSGGVLKMGKNESIETLNPTGSTQGGSQNQNQNQNNNNRRRQSNRSGGGRRGGSGGGSTNSNRGGYRRKR